MFHKGSYNSIKKPNERLGIWFYALHAIKRLKIFAGGTKKKKKTLNSTFYQAHDMNLQNDPFIFVKICHL